MATPARSPQRVRRPSAPRGAPRPRATTARHQVVSLALALVIAVVLAACGGDDTTDATAAAPTATEAPDDTAPADGVEQATAGAGSGEAGSTGDADADADEIGDDGAAGDTESADPPPPGVPDRPVYSTDVLPILESSCASCHGPGGPGATHLELATADDAFWTSTDIHLATAAGVMPPWPATDLSVPFIDDLSLDDTQRAILARWVEQGGEIDVDPTTPIVSRVPLAVIEDPDLVLTSAAGPYQGSTDVLDDYRCLVFDPAVTESEWILANHFEPDQVPVVHHAIVTLADASLRPVADALDAAQEGPGWTCYGGTGLGAEGLDGGGGGGTIPLGGWAPGGRPARAPEGYAIPLDPGDFIVVQIHYHYDEEAPADLSRLTLDLASDEEIAAAGGSFARLTPALYLGPAEIPCVAGDTHPLCDRDAALARVGELYGPVGTAIAEAITARCGYTPDDFAHMTDGEAWSTCDLPVTNPGRIVSVTGHMHELGLAYRMTLNPDTPDEVVLLDIADWDFDWQYAYRPVDEIVIERGDTIRVECRWGRDRAPYEAVGWILWAEGTGDEMCYSSVVTAPTGG